MNEDPTEKLIRELQEENEKLKKLVASGKIDLRGEDTYGMTEAGEELACMLNSFCKKGEKEKMVQKYPKDACGSYWSIVEPKTIL